MTPMEHKRNIIFFLSVFVTNVKYKRSLNMNRLLLNKQSKIIWSCNVFADVDDHKEVSKDPW